MRESLTVLAILAILVLSAALAVPYFVDWNAERGLVETQLSELLGRPVKVRGAIDLKLLPTPYLMLADVQVGAPTAEPNIKIDEIQLEIALPALLRGEVDFVEANLVRPRLTLEIKDGVLPLAAPIHRFSGQMRFDRISVEDGAVNISDPATDRTYAFNSISLSAEAESLFGPYKAQGRFAFAGQPSDFHFAASRRHGDRLHFKLIVDETRQHPRADIDADLIFARSNGGLALPSVAGQVKLSGRFAGAIALPWQLSGTLQAALHKAAIHDLDLRLGDEDHGVSFTGAAEFDLGRAPRANATLKGQQLDLDQLLSAQGSPPAMQRLAQALAGLLGSDHLTAFGMPLALEWSADAAILGGDTLNDVSGGFSVADKQSAWLRFEALGPGRSHLRLNGDVETGIAPSFKGHIEAGANDVPRLAEWLRINLPQSAPFLAELPIHSFDVSGTANVSQIGFVGQDLALRFDRSKLAGTLAYTQSVGGDPARLFADLSASRLDLDSLPDLSGLAGKAKAMDLSLRLDAHAVRVRGFGEGGLAAGQIHLELEKTGGIAKLDELAVTGLDGANIAAQGRWDGTSGTINAAVDSASLDAAAALLHRLAPNRVTDALLARAADLSPAHLALSAQGGMTAKREIGLQSLSLTGTAGETKVAAKVNGDPKQPADLIVSGTLAAPDGLALLRQIGVSALPLEDLGAGQVALTARGGLGKPFATRLTASLAGTSIAFDGTVAPDLAAPHASGALHLVSGNLTPLLEATGFAFPGPTTRLAADVTSDVDARSGDLSLRNMSGHFAGTSISGGLAYDTAAKHLTGALNADRLSLATLTELALGEASPAKAGTLWPDAKFAAAMVNPPLTSLSLTAQRFDLWPHVSGRDVRLGLDISGGAAGLKLALQHISMQLGSGSAAGDFTLRRDRASAAVAGHLKLSDYDLILPNVRGRLSADLDLAGTGDSLAAVIGGLAGSGSVSFADLVLPRSDPNAMVRVFKAVEDDVLGLDPGEIDQALASELAKNASRFGSVAFDAGLAAGVLRLTPKDNGARDLGPGVSETLQASLDLGTLTLDQRTSLTLLALPQNWSGPPPQITLIAKGALADPVETIESATFVNALAARAIARESARIEAQEFDVHEQAFFYNRLKSEREREQQKLKAQQAARIERMKAEEKKRKAEEATRAEAPLPIERQAPSPAQSPVWPTLPVDPLAAGRY